MLGSFAPLQPRHAPDPASLPSPTYSADSSQDILALESFKQPTAMTAAQKKAAVSNEKVRKAKKLQAVYGNAADPSTANVKAYLAAKKSTATAALLSRGKAHRETSARRAKNEKESEDKKRKASAVRVAESMARIERARWEEIKRKEAKQPAKKAAPQKAPTRKYPMGGYSGVTKQPWVGVMDSPLPASSTASQKRASAASPTSSASDVSYESVPGALETSWGSQSESNEGSYDVTEEVLREKTPEGADEEDERIQSKMLQVEQLVERMRNVSEDYETKLLTMATANPKPGPGPKKGIYTRTRKGEESSRLVRSARSVVEDILEEESVLEPEPFLGYSAPAPAPAKPLPTQVTHSEPASLRRMLDAVNADVAAINASPPRTPATSHPVEFVEGQKFGVVQSPGRVMFGGVKTREDVALQEEVAQEELESDIFGPTTTTSSSHYQRSPPSPPPHTSSHHAAPHRPPSPPLSDSEEYFDVDPFSVVNLLKMDDPASGLGFVGSAPTATTAALSPRSPYWTSTEPAKQYSTAPIDDDEWDATVQAMLAIENTRDVVEGRSPSKLEVSQSATENAYEEDYEDEFEDEFEEPETPATPTPATPTPAAPSAPPTPADPATPPSSTPAPASLNTSSSSSTTTTTSSSSTDDSYTTAADISALPSPAPRRYTPSQLQDMLLSELALSDALADQLLQLNDVEKMYTISAANAETARVKDGWLKDSDHKAQQEELKNQQHAYELTLMKVVEETRLQYGRNANPNNPGDIENESPNPQPTSAPLPPPPTAPQSQASLAHSASMYSDDFDLENGTFDDLQSDLHNDASLDVSDLNAGGDATDISLYSKFRKDHSAAVARRQKEEEALLSIRETAFREMAARQIKTLTTNKYAPAKVKSETKKIKRMKAAALADVNRERWALRGRMYREENTFMKTLALAPSENDDPDGAVGNILMQQYYLYQQRPPLDEGNLTADSASHNDGDSMDIVAMRSKLSKLSKKQAMAKQIMKEKVKEQSVLTEALVKEALGSGAALTRRDSMASVTTMNTEENYDSDSFEDWNDDNKSVVSQRSNRSNRSQRSSRSKKRSPVPIPLQRQETQESVVEENMDDVEKSDSSEFLSSVDDDEVDRSYGRQESRAEEVDEADVYEEEPSTVVSVAEDRQSRYAYSHRSMASEVGEGNTYAMESFETFDGGVGGKSGLLAISVPGDGGFADAAAGTMTMTQPSSRQSSFGKREKSKSPHGRKSKSPARASSADDVNDSDATDASMESIKIRVRELQKQVDRKQKEQRKKEERMRLENLEAELLRELGRGDGSVRSGGGKSVRSERSGRLSIKEDSMAGSGTSSMHYSKNDTFVSTPGSVSRVEVAPSPHSPGPSLSASALSNSAFGRGIAGMVEGVVGEEENGGDEHDSVESAVLSDSFRSRDSGGGSDSDDEAAVRRTERRAIEDKAAKMLQKRARGIVGRLDSSHRRAVVDRMVRKAREDERDLVVERIKSEHVLGEEEEYSSLELSVEGREEEADEDAVARMVRLALYAADAAAGDGAEGSFVGSDNSGSDGSGFMAERVECAMMLEDSFASGFGESANFDSLMSSMAEENVENIKTATMATEAAVDAVGKVVSDLVLGRLVDEVWGDLLGKDEFVKDVWDRESAATTLQKRARGGAGREAVGKKREEKRKREVERELERLEGARREAEEKEKERMVEEKRKKERGVVLMQGLYRGKLGRERSVVLREKARGEEAERVRVVVKVNAEKEAEAARERMKERKEATERGKEREKREKERKAEVEGDRITSGLVDRLVREEVERALKERREMLAKLAEAKVHEKIFLSVPKEETRVPEEEKYVETEVDILARELDVTGDLNEGDDDEYDFGVAPAASNVVSTPPIVSSPPPPRLEVPLEFDWRGRDEMYEQKLLNVIKFEELSEYFTLSRAERKMKGLRREDYIDFDMGGLEGSGSLSGSLSSLMSLSGFGLLGEEEGKAEVLPLDLFLGLEMAGAEAGEEDGMGEEIKAGCQMRNKALFDRVNDVIAELVRECQGGGGAIVIGTIARSMGVGVRVSRQAVADRIGKGEREGGHGVYDAGGDEEWAVYMREMEEDVKDNVVEHIMGIEVGKAVDDMIEAMKGVGEMFRE